MVAPKKPAAPRAKKPASRAAVATARGEETKAKILAAALGSFHKLGFEATTMRDIAAQAGVALGAAYYYFPSKDAIVLAYYEDTQHKSDERSRAAFEKSTDVRERLGAAMHARLDVLRADRRLLSALFRSIADPSADASIFSARTHDVRAQSMRGLADALSVSPEFTGLDADARRVVVLALWSLQMGFILYFLHDDSPRQQKTRALVDAVLDLVAGTLPLAQTLAPVLGAQVAAILRDAELMGPGKMSAD